MVWVLRVLQTKSNRRGGCPYPATFHFLTMGQDVRSRLPVRRFHPGL